MFLAIHKITEAIVTVIGRDCEKRVYVGASPQNIVYSFFPPSNCHCVLSDRGLWQIELGINLLSY